MSTFNTIARRVIVEAGLSEYGITPEFILDAWLKSRYKEVLDSVSFGSVNNQYRTRFSTIATYTTGTVSIIQGTNIVVGSGVVWDNSFFGRQIRITGDDFWYQITEVTDSTHLKIETAWSMGSVSGVAYIIGRRYYELALEVKWIIAVLLNGTELPNITPEALNTLAPTRPAAVGIPQYWSTPSWALDQGNRVIELYPPPDVVYTIDVVGYVNVAEPTLATVPINEIDERMLLRGVLADALIYRASRQTDLNMAEVSIKLAGVHEIGYRALLDNLKRRDAMWVV